DAVWPRVAAAVPAARFRIAGRRPVAPVLALAERPGIAVAADVPDMAQEIGRCWVSIAPMQSGVGIKNKVLEAWACARPVVLTPLATNGLTLPPGQGALVHAGGDAMADAVIRLFGDAATRLRLGQSAQAHVRTHFTWASAARRIEALLR
ncbi:MAG TPA: glycosyltransferase, partial [Pirellulaceae bacterium]|nr:glycosyltransferase [Pirellulaceae bacterium]